jgi:hypothetical protein
LPQVTREIARNQNASACMPSGKLVASQHFLVAIGDQVTIFFIPDQAPWNSVIRKFYLVC